MVDTDACRNACLTARCGDGATQAGVEECDDGNPSNTDACTAMCRNARCGDGFARAGAEECDDGNPSNTDACLTTCASARCGDAFVQAGVEACDDGSRNGSPGACNLTCTAGAPAAATACATAPSSATTARATAPTRLQRHVHRPRRALRRRRRATAPSECDDGNMVDTDACRNTCVSARCGDGMRNGVEECDDGNSSDTDACLNLCVAARCGDGVVRAGAEACDDGNMSNTDMCSNACKNTLCMPSGARAAFNQISMDTASGCWSGNPCDNDNYSFNQNDGQNFQGFNQQIACKGPATCVAHVGIATYQDTFVCQGTWDVLCDGVSVGQINTLGKTCTGSAMANGCDVTFLARMCTEITLRAAAENDGTSNCCGGSSPDSMLVAASAW
jgi:cysteine-rich repeat protein